MNNAFGLPLPEPPLGFASQGEHVVGPLPQQVFGHPPAEFLRCLVGASNGPGLDRRDPCAVRSEDAGTEVEEISFESGPGAHWRQASTRQGRQTGTLGTDRRMG